MSNLATNPWSFTSTDVNTAAIVAATGLTLNADGTVTLTTTAPATFAAGQGITVIGATNAIYNGFYFLLTATSTTVFQLVPQPFTPNRIPAGTAASGSGTAIFNQYNSVVRAEDISWQNPGTGQSLDIRDRNGNIVWQATSTAAAATANAQNRGKLMWIWGISINTLGGGIVLVTIN